MSLPAFLSAMARGALWIYQASVPPWLLWLCGGWAFCNWQPTRLLPRHLDDRGLRRPAEGRGADADGKEIVYNYFSQDYALITRKEKPFDPGQWLSELLPWSAGELKARDAIDEVLPKWRDLEVGPRTEEALRRRFRALTAATGGEEAALAAMKKNIAVMYFAEGQIQSAGEVLQRKLGKERASEVIQKNPGALTIDPKNLESNIAAVCLAADAVNVIVSNAEVSRFAAGGIGLFFAIGLGKATFDVIALRAFSG